MMRVCLVSGPIAGGKSEACRYLASKGYPVYDSDSRAKALYESVPGLKEQVCNAAGLPFERLGEMFEDPCKVEAVNAIVHPLVRKDFEQWKSMQDSDVVVFESALSQGSRWFDGVFDTVILVRAPYRTRLSRNPKVALRDSLQSFDYESADYVIDNDTDITELRNKIDSIQL